MTLLPTLLLTAAAAAVAEPDYAALLDTIRNDQDVPGYAAAVVRGDDLLFAGGAGYSDLAARAPVSADTHFYLGSVSKVITAIFVLSLADDGLVELDRDLGFRERGDGPAVTPRQLLSHGSGLSREGPFGYWFSGDFPARPAVIDYAAEAELAFEPGSDLRYSNVAYAVLGHVAAETTATHFDVAVERRVLAPLGMSASGTRGPAPDPARGYTPPGRVLPGRDRPFAGVGETVGDRRLREYHDANGMAPAFGAYSNATDMARLLRFLVGVGGDAVLPAPERKRLYETQSSGWGLGLEPDRLDGREIARHGGWFAAHRTHLLIDPVARIGIVVMANGDNANPAAAAVALYRAALAATPTSGSP